MFSELLNSESHSIRGKTFTFHEISSLDWINHLVMEEEPDDQSHKALAVRNRAFLVRVIAASLAPGVGSTVPELVAEMEPLSESLISELFAAADQVNGITERLNGYAGKASPADDTAAA